MVREHPEQWLLQSLNSSKGTFLTSSYQLTQSRAMIKLNMPCFFAYGSLSLVHRFFFSKHSIIHSFYQAMQMSTISIAFIYSFSFLTSAFYFFRCYHQKDLLNQDKGSKQCTDTTALQIAAEKQISWFLTFITSLICTLISAPFVLQFYWRGFDMTLLTKNTSFHQVYVCFFISYLILDLALGSIYYRRRVTVVTGWIHHLFYITLLSSFLYLQIPSLFTIMSILELPTLILAAGSIVRSWRSDALFGSTFFILRIVLHGWMIFLLKRKGQGNDKLDFVWIVGLLIYPMHLYWFKGFALLLYKKHQSS